MFYSIRHLTKFRYSRPVSESIMELRMHPRSEGVQRCLSFELNVTPKTRVQSYRDHLGNVVHHFNVPSAHRQLTIIAEAMVDVSPRLPLPDRLNDNAWDRVARAACRRRFLGNAGAQPIRPLDRSHRGFRAPVQHSRSRAGRATRSFGAAARAEFTVCRAKSRTRPKPPAWIRRPTTRCATARASARITRTS